MVPSTAPHPGLGQAGCFTLIQGIPFITLHGVPAGPCQGPSSLSPHFLLCPVVTSPCRQGKLSNREEEEEYLGFVFLSATGAGQVQSQTGPELCSSPKSRSHLQPQIPVPAAPSSSSQLSTPSSSYSQVSQLPIPSGFLCTNCVFPTHKQQHLSPCREHRAK